MEVQHPVQVSAMLLEGHHDSNIKCAVPPTYSNLLSFLQQPRSINVFISNKTMLFCIVYVILNTEKLVIHKKTPVHLYKVAGWFYIVN